MLWNALCSVDDNRNRIRPFPITGHSGLITVANKKLSKRDDAFSVQSQLDDGVLPEALFNFVLKLGWGWSNNEIVSLEEAVAHFHEGKLNKKAQINADFNKLSWLNKQWSKMK